MDGLLLIDKPAGPTSHDVVARMRRALGEKRIGHTGTLDPAATGILALVLGRATRLAQFLSASDKSYDAVVRLGFSTDTADARGRATGSVRQGPFPSREAIDAALHAFRGTFLQQPPAFSAKRIDGTRSHKLARARARVQAQVSDTVADRPQVSDTAVAALPAPARVTAHAIEILGCEGDLVTLRVDCSAGFYVRSLAHDLGERLETGAHLASLRRTRSGTLTLSQALDLDVAERDPRRAEAAIIPPAEMLPELTAVVLNSEGVARAVHGRELGPGDCSGDLTGFGIRGSGLTLGDHARIPAPDPGRPLVRLLDLAGHLVGIAVPAATPGLLHPSIVLM
jgi:tRNA pseudouridine55 synthase